jgi:hypothetical protein
MFRTRVLVKGDLMHLFHRPVRRRPSRLTRGSRLRLERLDARDCPAAPVLTSTSVSWLTNGQVLVRGTVQDENPAGVVIHLSGGLVGSATADATGRYSVQLTPTAAGALYVQALDTEGLTSATQTMPAVMDQTPPPPPREEGGLRITDIEITNEGGIWKITGKVEGLLPGTVVRIDSSNPDWNGRTVAIEDPDGGFEIGHVPTTGDPGGSIGIIAEAPNGKKSNKIHKTID